MNTFLTRVQTFYIPASSSVDSPQYRPSAEYTVHLSSADFSSLVALKLALQEKTKAGYIQNQFFQVAFKNEFQGVHGYQGAFLTTSEELRLSFQSQPSVIELVVVKYTKAQAKLLHQLVSKEELPGLVGYLQSVRKNAPDREESEEETVNFAERYKDFYPERMLQKIGNGLPAGWPVVDLQEEFEGFTGVQVPVGIYRECLKFAAKLNSE
ncbi:Conserved_hypothetical protein [Hexamita inflata]|uniref:Uncharacterized protein n=1 Tax=Hexamita inflata TaxID=28002 RepID=A0ABP1JGC5_9EUKA